MKYRDTEIDTTIISGGASLLGVGVSLAMWGLNGSDLLNPNFFGMLLSLLLSPMQIYYAAVKDLRGRNWTNMVNGVLCIAVALSVSLSSYNSLIGRGVDSLTVLEINGAISAVGGFASVGVLQIKYWWYTSRLKKHK